jgi:hypothetical protein
MEEHIFPLSFAKEAAEAEIGSHAVERRLIQALGCNVARNRQGSVTLFFWIVELWLWNREPEPGNS